MRCAADVGMGEVSVFWMGCVGVMIDFSLTDGDYYFEVGECRPL